MRPRRGGPWNTFQAPPPRRGLRGCGAAAGDAGDGLVGTKESHDHGDHAEAHFARWACEEGLHDSRQVRAELERRFAERHFEWVPYLYPDLADGVSEADESAAIESGTINAT